MKFWKLSLYTLFLVYPAISSTVLGHYVCKDIEGEHFLWKDLRIKCYDEKWTAYSFASISLVIMYPIGIPAFFFLILRVNRHHLQDNRIRAQLGFLYGGYQQEHWWFEMVDTAHKLFQTSILAFFQFYQIQVGMVVAVLYLMAILRLNPYLRKQDDLLAMLSQSLIFLLLLAGLVFYNLGGQALSETDDLVMSISLIAVVAMFFAIFVLFATAVVRDAVTKWWEKRKKAKLAGEDKEGMSNSFDVHPEEDGSNKGSAWGDDQEGGDTSQAFSHSGAEDEYNEEEEREEGEASEEEDASQEEDDDDDHDEDDQEEDDEDDDEDEQDDSASDDSDTQNEGK